MGKQRIQLSEKAQKELERGYRESGKVDTRTRYQAVRLYSQGYRVSDICQITGCNRTSLLEWWRKYREEGLSGLTDHRGGPVRAKLSQTQRQELAQKLRSHRPHDVLGPEAHTSGGQHWTIEDLAVAVERWYGVTWKSRVSYHSLLLACGFSYQRTEKVYKSRREADVIDWKATIEKKL